MTATLILKLKTISGDPAKIRVNIIEKDGMFVNINKLTISKADYRGVTILKKFKDKNLYLESITMRLDTFYEVVQFVNYIENKDKAINLLKQINRNHRLSGDVN